MNQNSQNVARVTIMLTPGSLHKNGEDSFQKTSVPREISSFFGAAKKFKKIIKGVSLKVIFHRKTRVGESILKFPK